MRQPKSDNPNNIHESAVKGSGPAPIRTCPRCSFPLAPIQPQGIELDHCRRCRGTFFDPGEAQQMFGIFVSPDVWENSSMTTFIGPSRLVCPNESETLWAYSVEFGEQDVEIDMCRMCGGMWLDAGEGKRLRDLVMRAGQSKQQIVPRRSKHGIASYLFQMASLLPREIWNPRQKFARITLFLIIAFAVVYVLQGFLDARYGIDLSRFFGQVPSEILRGRKIWTMLTSSFLHANLYHLLGNAYFLYIFGDNVEDFLGSRRFLMLYFFSALGGAMLQILFQGDPRLTGVGASAAIAGLMGAYLVFFPHIKLFQVLLVIRFRVSVIWYLGLWILYNLIMAFTGTEDVGWMAHVGGFLTGALLAIRYRVRPLVDRLPSTPA